MSSYLDDPGYLAGEFDLLDASNATVGLAESPDETQARALAVRPADTVNLPIFGAVKKDHLLIIVGIVAIVAIYLLMKQRKKPKDT